MNFDTYARASTLVITAICAMTGTVFAGPPEEEEHFDVWVRLVDGGIVTGSISEDETPLDEQWRVFGAEFGEPFGSRLPLAVPDPLALLPGRLR